MDTSEAMTFCETDDLACAHGVPDQAGHHHNAICPPRDILIPQRPQTHHSFGNATGIRVILLSVRLASDIEALARSRPKVMANPRDREGLACVEDWNDPDDTVLDMVFALSCQLPLKELLRGTEDWRMKCLPKS